MGEWEEQEGGENNGDEGDGAQTEGMTIRDQDDARQWEEEGHQWLTAKSEFYMPEMGWSLPRTRDGSSRHLIL